MSDVDFDARMKELMGEFTNLTGEAHKLKRKSKKIGKILSKENNLEKLSQPFC